MNGSLEVVILQCRKNTEVFGSPTWFSGLRPIVASQLSSPTNSQQSAAEERRRVSVPLPRLEACQPFPTPRQPGPSDAQVVVA